VGQATRKHEDKPPQFLPEVERPNMWGYRVAVKGKKMIAFIEC
jgi:hypothetical protein